jgi:hypothetical protein
MKVTVFIWLVISLICSACKKESGEGKTTVEGQAIDVTTNKPVSFAVIRIDAANKRAAYGGNNIPIKDEKADAEGRFSTSFDAEAELTYSLGGGLRDNYYTAAEVLVKSARRNQNLTLKLQPYGWVKVKLINEPPLDVAEVHIQGFHDMDITTLTKSDENYIRKIDGNKSVNISYYIRPNGDTMYTFSPNIYAKALDTSELIIKY